MHGLLFYRNADIPTPRWLGSLLTHLRQSASDYKRQLAENVEETLGEARLPGPDTGRVLDSNRRG